MTETEPQTAQHSFLSADAFQVGEWVIFPSLLRIRRAETEEQVQPRIMRLLVALAEAKGQVVSKEYLTNLLWPDVVVTETALARAISELRRHFGDSAAQSAYIETIRTIGYRMVADVHPVLLHQEKELAVRVAARSVSLILVLSVAITSCLVGWMLWSSDVEHAPPFGPAVPVSHGFEDGLFPAISAAGHLVAFVAQAEESTTWHIFVQGVDSSEPVQLTQEPFNYAAPVFYEGDGALLYQQIKDDGTCQVVSQSVMGSTPRVLGTCGRYPELGLSVSADERWVYFASRPDELGAAKAGASLYRLNIQTGAVETLTQPRTAQRGDLSPIVVDRQVIFARSVSAIGQDLHVLDLETRQLRRLTHEDADIKGIAWDPATETIVYGADRGDGYHIWRLDPATGEEMWMRGSELHTRRPAFSANGFRMVYESGDLASTLVEIDLRSPDATKHVIDDTHLGIHPAVAPAGDRIAYISDRAGSYQLWMQERDHYSPAQQMTSFDTGLVSSPAWSQDGRQIAFIRSTDGRYELYVMDVGTRLQQHVLTSANQIRHPVWLSSDKQVLVSLDQGGKWNLWYVDLATGEMSPYTTKGGYRAVVSPATGQAYFSKRNVSGVWGLDEETGREALIFEDVDARYWGSWSLAETGFYYFTVDATTSDLWYRPEDTPSTRDHVAHFDHPLSPQSLIFDIARDASFAILAQGITADLRVYYTDRLASN